MGALCVPAIIVIPSWWVFYHSLWPVHTWVQNYFSLGFVFLWLPPPFTPTSNVEDASLWIMEQQSIPKDTLFWLRTWGLAFSAVWPCQPEVFVQDATCTTWHWRPSWCTWLLLLLCWTAWHLAGPKRAPLFLVSPVPKFSFFVRKAFCCSRIPLSILCLLWLPETYYLVLLPVGTLFILTLRCMMLCTFP